MKKLLIIILLQVVFVDLTFSQTTQTDLKLWYTNLPNFGWRLYHWAP